MVSKKEKYPPEKILTPASVTRALSNTSSRLKYLKTSSIMLPFIFPWMDCNKIITEQVWPAEQLVDTFIDELTKLTLETHNKINIIELNTISNKRSK